MHRLEICNKSLLYQSILWNRLLRYEIRKQISSISTHQSTWLGINLFLNMTTDVKWYYLTWVSTIFYFLAFIPPTAASVFVRFHFFHISFSANIFYRILLYFWIGNLKYSNTLKWHALKFILFLWVISFGLLELAYL